MTYWRVRLGRFGPALATYPSGTTFGPRVNKDFELVWLVSGRATWVRHDLDFRLGLKPGTLLLTRPGMMDELLWREPSRHGYVHIGLEPVPDADGWPSSPRPTGWNGPRTCSGYCCAYSWQARCQASQPPPTRPPWRPRSTT